jgi:hypothetical protein
VSPPASTSIPSLSLSLTSTSRCLLYLSIFSVRMSSSVSAKKAETGAKLTAPVGCCQLCTCLCFFCRDTLRETRREDREIYRVIEM